MKRSLSSSTLELLTLWRKHTECNEIMKVKLEDVSNYSGDSMEILLYTTQLYTPNRTKTKFSGDILAQFMHFYSLPQLLHKY